MPRAVRQSVTLDDALRAIAVAEERAAVAEQRALELARSNEAMQTIVDAMPAIEDFDQFAPAALHAIANAFGAGDCAFYEHFQNGMIRLRYWFRQGLVLTPGDLLALNDDRMALIRQLATQFSVPDSYLGTTVRDRTRAVILDHRRGTSVPEFDEFAVSNGWDLELNVPLVVGNYADGALVIFRSYAQPFTTGEITLAETLGKQLALAMQAEKLARQAKAAVVSHERQVAAEKRIAGLSAVNNVLKRSLTHLTSQDDLRSFLGAVLVEAVNTADAVSGSVFLHDPHTNTIRSEAFLVRGELVDLDNDPRSAAFREPVPANTGRAWEYLGGQRRPYWVDYGGAPDPDDWPQSHAWHNAHGHRFVGCMPMFLGETVIGFLGLAFDKSVDVQPSLVRLEICQSLAQHATLAVRLTRLAEEAKQTAIAREREAAAERRATGLARTNDALKLTLDASLFEPELDKVLGNVLIAITQHLGSKASAVWLPDRNSGRFCIHLVYHQGKLVDPASESGVRLKGAWGSGRDLYFKDYLSLRKPVVYQVDALRLTDPRAFQFFNRLGVHTLLGIPLLLGDEIAGSLTIRFDTRRELGTEDLELAQAMAHQATMAIQLTRLAVQAAESAVLGERTRLAREIHDTISQSLVAILLHSRAALSGDEPMKRIEVVSRLAEDSLDEARLAMQALRPVIVGNDGLAGAMNRMAKQFRYSSDISVRLKSAGDNPILPKTIEDEITFIVREAVSNAITHSGATEVLIEMTGCGSFVNVVVQDEGVGFAVELVPGDRYGIVGMLERATRIGAALTIISEPGRGTKVVLAWQPHRSQTIEDSR